MRVCSETLKDAVLFQRAKVEVVSGSALNFSEKRGQILLHLLSLKNSPLSEDKHGHQTLAGKSRLKEKPPTITFEQISIVIVDDSTLISIRADADLSAWWLP